MSDNTRYVIVESNHTRDRILFSFGLFTTKEKAYSRIDDYKREKKNLAYQGYVNRSRTRRNNAPFVYNDDREKYYVKALAKRT